MSYDDWKLASEPDKDWCSCCQEILTKKEMESGICTNCENKQEDGKS